MGRNIAATLSKLGNDKPRSIGIALRVRRISDPEDITGELENDMLKTAAGTEQGHLFFPRITDSS